LVIIGGGGVSQSQRPGSGIAFIVRPDVSSSSAATGFTNIVRRRRGRSFPQAEASVNAGAGTSVLVANVELEHATFEVTAPRIVAHALGLVIILDCGVIQLQGSGSGIALSIRREVSARCAAAGRADIVRRRCNFSRFLPTQALVNAGARTSVLVANVELEHVTFEVTAARIVGHAVLLVIIRGGGVPQSQRPGSGIA